MLSHSSFFLSIDLFTFLSCSNIALKCNTKLYNVCNKAHAWQVSSNQGVGVPWVCEVPTLVIGISLSHGEAPLELSISPKSFIFFIVSQLRNVMV